MVGELLKIAFLCVVLGSASIPISFTISSDPLVVWFGNALGSLFSAVVVIFVDERIASDAFKKKISRFRIGRKVVKIYDQGDKNKHINKARSFINRHGLKIFALLCPIFPGVLLSTTAVYMFDLDKQTFKRWMLLGVFLVSGLYVLSYWWLFIK